MKLKINSLLGSLIIIAIISVFSFPAFATDVGGIIYTDTTWTLSGSPYNVISNVQIPEGIVLTVEPGVKIYDVTQYSNGNIQVWGSFNAIGTTSSTIILNSVNLYSESNSAMITIKYSELNYTPIYQYYGNLVLEDSEINYLDQCAIASVASIERNVFSNSRGIRVNSGFAYIRNNLFFQQTEYAIRAEIASASGVIAELNSFLSTDRIAVRLDDSSDITALNNYWGTTNPTVIESMIYDGNDEYPLNIVEFEPFLSEPHPNTPALTPTANAGTDQIVFDEIILDASHSEVLFGEIVSYQWDIVHRDNTAYNRNAEGLRPTVSNLKKGFYDVILIVEDNFGSIDTDEMFFSATGLKGDFDFDGNVDGSDLAEFAEKFGTSE